jgi:hypothetical protein
MTKNLYNLRFGIKREDGYISNIWRLWITLSGDVYLTTRGSGGIEKYSFHQSGICRRAFTREHGTPTVMSDRAMFKWIRASTPPMNNGGASRVAWLAFPTAYLSRLSEMDGKEIIWIPAAPSEGATYLELCYTFETENTVMTSFHSNGRHLVSYTPLPSGEAFFLNYYHADWENKDLRSPAAKGSIFPDLLFSADDPRDTGRPVRIQFGTIPKDGDALRLQELGGYEDTMDSA